MTLTLPTDHASPSQVGMYLRCGEQYRRRYVQGERRPPGLAMLRGTGVHGGAAHRNGVKMDSGEETTKDDLVDVAVAYFDAGVEKAGEVDLTDEERRQGLEKAVGAARDETASLAGGYSDLVAPLIVQPIAVEEKVTIDLSIGVQLLGYIDLVHEVEGETILEDLKTGKKVFSQDDVDADRQLAWYAMSWRHRTGDYPEQTGIRTLRSLKKGPKSDLITSVKGDADTAALLATIDAVLRGISAGSFPPALHGTWWCSRKWCGWFDSCKYIASRR